MVLSLVFIIIWAVQMEELQITLLASILGGEGQRGRLIPERLCSSRPGTQNVKVSQLLVICPKEEQTCYWEVRRHIWLSGSYSNALCVCVLSQKQVKSFPGWMLSAVFSTFLPFGSCAQPLSQLSTCRISTWH